jgi:hypothetical protein
MWLTFFATPEARRTALLYGVGFIVVLFGLGIVVHWLDGTY